MVARPPGARDPVVGPAGRERRRWWPPSLRGLGRVVVASGAVLVVAIALIVLSAKSLRGAVESVVRDTYSLDLVDRLDAELFRYARVSNEIVTTGDPRSEVTRLEIEEELYGLVEGLKEFSGSAAEDRRIEHVRERVGAYLAERRSAEAEGLGLREILSRTSPRLTHASDAVEELKGLNERELAGSQSRAARLQGVSNAAGGLALVLALGGMLLLTVIFRRQIVVPLTCILQTVQRFRAGDLTSSAPEEGPREICEIARAFNQATSEIAERRANQLAFLAGVAHDLRNPLAAMKSATQLLREERLDPEAADSVERLDRQVDRLARMVSDLADATQIEAGQLEIHAERHDLRGDAREMVELYAPTSPAHRITLAVPEEPVVVRADPLRIEEVVSNLLSNAIKYSPKGGAIEVSVGSAGGEAILSVADHGPGIPADQIEEIFLPFRRGPWAALAHGSGLGLSVIRKIVDAHGGRIDVESEPGRGSTFFVRLPLAQPG